MVIAVYLLQLYYLVEIKRIEMKTAGPIIIILLVVSIIITYIVVRNKQVEEFNNQNGDIYHESFQNKVVLIEQKYRSNHLILDNGQDYYFGIIKIQGKANHKLPIEELINEGDSIYKDAKSSKFRIRKTNGDEFVIVFHSKR